MSNWIIHTMALWTGWDNKFEYLGNDAIFTATRETVGGAKLTVFVDPKAKKHEPAWTHRVEGLADGQDDDRCTEPFPKTNDETVVLAWSEKWAEANGGWKP